jgi:hypothetical protein
LVKLVFAHTFETNASLGAWLARQVIVVEDENGNVVRETMKDNDVLAQYKSMREVLVYLCHLDYEDTETQMLDKLRQQVAPARGGGGLGVC